MSNFGELGKDASNATVSDADFLNEKATSPETTTDQVASEAFYQHVNEIRAERDAIDAQPHSRFHFIQNCAIASSAVVTELCVADVQNSTPAVVGLIALMTAVVCSAGLDEIGRRKGNVLLNATNQRIVGQRYELLKPHTQRQRKDVVPELFWYGPQVKENDGPVSLLVEDLHKMATLAEHVGIKRMHVDKKLAMTINSAQASRETSTPSSAIIREAKHVIVNTPKDERVITLSPKEWLQWTSGETDAARQDVYQTLKTTLATIRPEHPLVLMLRNAELRKANQSFPKNRIAVCANEALVRRLTEQVSLPNQTYQDSIAQRIDTGSAPISKTTTLHETAVIKKDCTTAIMRTAYGPYPAVLIKKLGFRDEKEVTALLEKPGLDPVKAEIAVELALLRLARDKPVIFELPATDAGKTPTVAYSRDGLQSKLFQTKEKHYSLLGQRLVRIGAAAVLAAITATGVTYAHNGMDTHQKKAVAGAKNYLADEQHVTPDLITDEDAHKLANSRLPELPVWDGIKTAESYIDKMFGLHLGSHGVGTGESANNSASISTSNVSSVGNTGMDKKPDTIEFTLTPHGGANVAGYWPTGTSSTLEVGSERLPVPIRWILDTTISSSEGLPAELPQKYADKEWIQVDRDISPLDNNTNDMLASSSSVNIPVLEGDMPVAASYDGHEVKLLHKADNTYKIASEQEKMYEGHLRYWIVPNAKALAPKALRPVQITTDDGQHIPIARDGLLRLWNGEIKNRHLIPPNNSVNLTDKQLADLAQKDIKENWKYDYNPLSQNDLNNMQFFADFVRMSIDDQKAVCNTANTLINTINLEPNQVFGYSNGGGSGRLSLTSHEGHEWRTDGDATPTASTQNVSAHFSKPNTLGFSRDELLHSAEVTLASLVLLTQRRRLARYAQAGLSYTNGRHARKLDTYSENEIRYAQAFAEYMAYSGADRPHSDSIDNISSKLQQNQTHTSSALPWRTELLDADFIMLLRKNISRVNDKDFADKLKKSLEVLNRARLVHKATAKKSSTSTP